MLGGNSEFDLETDERCEAKPTFEPPYWPSVLWQPLMAGTHLWPIARYSTTYRIKSRFQTIPNSKFFIYYFFAAVHQLSIEVIRSLERLDEELLPAVLKVSLNETLNTVKALHLRPLLFLLAPEQKPKPLRLLEPKIEAVYDDIRRRPKNQQLSDRDKRRKLQQKVKKESRAAAREIRQDNEFIAKLQFKQRAASDRERREKVKRIFSDATTQQGELKSLDRKAKYKK